MISQQKRRLKFLILSGLSVSFGLGLLLFSLKENMMYFYTPSALKEASLKTGQKVRLGGLVKEGTFYQNDRTLDMVFEIWDLHQSIPVSYQGLLPDLFREGQGVVVEGFKTGQTFQATLVLAKHDENYRPPDVNKQMIKTSSSKTLSASPKNQGAKNDKN